MITIGTHSGNNPRTSEVMRSPRLASMAER